MNIYKNCLESLLNRGYIRTVDTAITRDIFQSDSLVILFCLALMHLTERQGIGFELDFTTK